MKNSKTYGVKSLFKISSIHKEKVYISTEERILVYSGSSFNEAIEKAEKDAFSYEGTWKNKFGEIVERVYMEECDAYEIKCHINCTNGLELFSEVKFFESPTTNDDLLSYAYGYDVENESLFREVLRPA